MNSDATPCQGRNQEQAEKLSVLLSIYSGESANFFSYCLRSLANQTRPADEVVIVKDGPIGKELEEVIAKFTLLMPITVVELPVNVGLGQALMGGIAACRYELVARMDSDDVCVPRRFEMQLAFLEQHPEIYVLGGNIREFETDPTEEGPIRRVPCSHEEIYSFAKMRNPINHMTVLFRKSAVLAAGNYRWRKWLEDYDLWVRMLLNGFRFHNLDEVLVYARSGNGMIDRRGGMDYLRREISLFRSFSRSGFISAPRALLAVAARVPTRLMPTSVRAFIYQTLLRKGQSNVNEVVAAEFLPVGQRSR